MNNLLLGENHKTANFDISYSISVNLQFKAIYKLLLNIMDINTYRISFSTLSLIGKDASVGRER